MSFNIYVDETELNKFYSARKSTEFYQAWWSYEIYNLYFFQF